MIKIPAIDLLDGKIVRLKQGQYDKVTVYHENPLSFAGGLKDKGYTRLHVVDLNGAKDGYLANLNIITEITRKTGLEVQTGGGIRSKEDIQTLFNAGISRVISSSLALKQSELWLDTIQTYGAKCIFGMDLKNGNIATGGWLDISDTRPKHVLKPMIKAGLEEVLCTDISKDGMMTGPNVALYKQLQEEFPELKFIASGGVSSDEDIKQLEQANLHAVVIGRAWLEGKLKSLL